MTPEHTNRPMVASRLATSLAGALGVVVGGLVLGGWALDVDALKRRQNESCRRQLDSNAIEIRVVVKTIEVVSL